MARSSYQPKRQLQPVDRSDPIEVGLVFNVRPCGTCDFFWPDKPSEQPYGPFPLVDFDPLSVPVQLSRKRKTTSQQDSTSHPWLQATTVDAGFPNGEVMDGCRKAPVMTIGINPNLTAFSPGQLGASWAYPDFTSANGTNEWEKYAAYYRYRSVYQERFALDAIRPFLLKEGQVIAENDGEIVRAPRSSSDPNFSVSVRYDGDDKDTTIPLRRAVGEPRYVILFDQFGPNTVFTKGDVIAAQLDVPAGEELTLWQQQQGYYEQFVPTLTVFEDFLKSKGHADPHVRIGEDVAQLDMVACASPHWNPGYLGGTSRTEQTIITNCVSKNGWAIKQLVQTRPAVLYLVGEASYNMFQEAFGALITRDPGLPLHPPDDAFTLFRETCDSKHPTMFAFDTEIDGHKFSIRTRLIVTPHFSFNSNFVPQFRLSRDDFAALQSKSPACAEFLTTDKRIVQQSNDFGFDSYAITGDPTAVLNEIKKEFPDCYPDLAYAYYDPHQMMAEVMEDLYEQGVLAYRDGTRNNPGYLERSVGSCHFCVNDHWSFPQGCPYGKSKLTAPPPGFLELVAQQIAQAGKPSPP